MFLRTTEEVERAFFLTTKGSIDVKDGNMCMTESFRQNLQIIFTYEIHKLCGSWKRHKVAMCGEFFFHLFIHLIDTKWSIIFFPQFHLMFLSFPCLSNQWQMGRKMFKKNWKCRQINPRKSNFIWKKVKTRIANLH